MTGSDARRLATLLSLEYERLLQHPAFATEVQRAQRQFFGPMAAAVPSLPQQQRFREWLLLERDSQTLGSQPWLLAAALQDEALFEDSLAGLFLVEQRSGRTAQVRDLQDQQRLDLISEEHDLQQGDMIVGRMYARGDGSLLPSAAVVVFRPGTALAQAFERDLERLELDRRLSQLEIEQLLLVHAARPQLASRHDEPTATAPPQLEHLEAELEKLLHQGGASYSATAISQVLQQAPRLGPAMGELLEQMAFDTRVDLDRVRAVLLQIWNVLHPEYQPGSAATPVPPADEDLGDQLVRTLDDGLAKGRDLDDLFSELEQMAGLDPDEDDGDLEPDGEEVEDWSADDDDDDLDDDDVDDDDPQLAGAGIADLTGPQLVDLDPRNGDLAPLVQEYLWETAQQQTPTARTLQTFVELQQQSPTPHSDLEAITGLDLNRVLLHVYLRSAPKERAGAVHAAFAVLQQFYAWAESTQDFDLKAPLQACQDELVAHVDRLAQFGQQFSTAVGSGGPTPCLMRVEDVGEHGFGVRVDGGDTFWVTADKAASSLLREGDLMLAAILPQGAGRGKLAGMVIALPQQAESLIG